jgi:RNA polymerase-binding transcription factor DksA
MAQQTHDSARAGPTRGGEYSRFEHKLRARWCDLRDETRAAMSRSDNETYAEEIRTIERALKRIALGTYGVCVSCGQPIERERLEAHPTANRCAACQRAYEHDHATTPTPRL